MSDIKPEIVDKAAKTLSGWSQHEYRGDIETCIPRCVCGWTATEPYDVEGFDRHITETVLATVADELRAEGAAQALREAADDIERRINEPDLILLADKYGGFHAGERHRAQREVDILRARAARIEHDARCPHRKCPGGSLCCCPEEARDE